MTLADHISTRPTSTRQPSRALAATCFALAAGWLPCAHAERADRTKPMEVTATQAIANQALQSADFSGNVVVSQGSLQISADRLQIRQGPNGERLGVAFGKAGAPVKFRQHGDRPDEWNEGQADRVEVDGAANQVRLIGAASLRNLSGTVVTQSVFSARITYDTARDTISSTQADQADAAAAAPGGQVKVIFAPHVAPAGDAASTAP